MKSYPTKLALLSDIHGNFRALEVVLAHIDRFDPDQVVVIGDIINRGPRSRQCWDLLSQRQASRGYALVIGNHEEYVANQAINPPAAGSPAAAIAQTSLWTAQFFQSDYDRLLALPFSLDLPGPQATVLRCAHASLRGSRDGIYFSTPNDVLRQQLGPDLPTVLFVGHTHLPLDRQIGPTRVINIGSVGLPFDGDSRAGYVQAVFGDPAWQINFVRIDYDRAEAQADFFSTGFFDGGGALVRLMLNELQTAQSRIGQWSKHYQQPVLDGQITIDQAVDQFLADYQ